eukprot:CAMPEP_0198591934 /NCGR_PEP_ID=MMETSP1462-20131121/137508_1 /TAXON_ID=1333877 /ORGANISM="Brandtodinium nutriculum, Strain RCC3387" /LENGTH=45 /DNA_ID= /DNA_START= /DNA_END= /DNA_ORIENTATION=
MEGQRRPPLALPSNAAGLTARHANLAASQVIQRQAKGGAFENQGG